MADATRTIPALKEMAIEYDDIIVGAGSSGTKTLEVLAHDETEARVKAQEQLGTAWTVAAVVPQTSA